MTSIRLSRYPEPPSTTIPASDPITKPSIAAHSRDLPNTRIGIVLIKAIVFFPPSMVPSEIASPGRDRHRESRR